MGAGLVAFVARAVRREDGRLRPEFLVRAVVVVLLAAYAGIGFGWVRGVAALVAFTLLFGLAAAVRSFLVRM
jgi:hypothetical protein